MKIHTLLKPLRVLAGLLILGCVPAAAQSPGSLEALDLALAGGAGGQSYAIAQANLPDGGLIVGGNFATAGAQPHANIVKVGPGGTIDHSFTANVAGVVNCVVVQPDGKIVIGGLFTTVNNYPIGIDFGFNNIARLHPNGTLDTSFHSALVLGAPYALGGFNGRVRSIAVQPDGMLVVVGEFTSFTQAPLGSSSSRIARLTADGAYDLSFNTSGGVSLGGANGPVYTCIAQANGKILIGGDFTTLNGTAGINRLARLNADGSRDTSFSASLNGSVLSTVVQPDGYVVVGGDFTSVNGSGVSPTGLNRLARLTGTGATDSTFNVAGGANAWVYGLALQSDGKILMAGGFTTLFGVSGVGRVARLNTNGTRDTSFGSGLVLANNHTNSVTLQADGKVLIGSIATTMNGVARVGFARLNNDAASQSLGVPAAGQVTWTRGGSAPDLSQATFETGSSLTGPWTPLATASRVGTTANWTATGLTLPSSLFLRARGRTLGGHNDGSSGLIEQIASFNLPYGAQPCGNWVAGRDLAANEQVTATETQNPNATVPAWSYGYRTTLASNTLNAFTPAQHTSSVYGIAGFDGFIASGTAAAPWIPLVLVNGTGATMARTNYSNLFFREIEMHPGASNELAVVRWTAPATGTYSISASWRDINASGGDGASANIVHNGTVIYSQVWANGGPGVAASFPSVSLQAGDLVDFAVGARGDYNSDSTAFDATIEAVTAPAAAPIGFALVPGGAFTMGDSVEGVADETPHTVNVSAFYMATTETTKTQWDETIFWISTSGLGYDISSAGGASGAAHPIQSLSWWNAVKWCNARSEQKGLTPCYTAGVSGTVVRSGTPANIVCDFTRNGYRLPTESEWEKAARGGIAGRRFATGNTLAHTTANYFSDHANTYDVSATSGYHPSYSVGTIYTAPAGSFPANPYGLYDMDGNVWEWCWDWYNTYPASGALNPQGVLDTAYQERVVRGGSWNFNAYMARTANRDSGLPAQITGHIGFRLAQTAIVLPPVNTPPCFALPASSPASPTGTAWTAQSAPAGSWSSIACSADGQRVIASVQNGSIYVSQDHGLNWVQQTVTVPLAANWKTVCASSDGNTLAAAAAGGRIWRRSGGVWAQTAAPIAAWQGLACSYDGQTLLASVAGGGLYTSSNGGTSWTFLTGAPTSANWRGVASSASGQHLLAAALTNVYASSDFGATWAVAGTGTALSLVAMSWDGGTRYATGSGESLLRGISGGTINSVLAGPTTWSSLACSWDGSVYGATASPGDLDVRDAAGVIHHAVLNATWSGMACSADGNRFYAAQSGATGKIYTSVPGTSGPSVAACSSAQSIPNFLTKVQPGPPCEAWQSVTFTVTNNNNALFTQQPAISPNGTLTYTAGTTAGTALVTVYATDNGGTANGGWNQSIWQTFPITITPDTAPTISNIADQSTVINTATGLIPFTIGDVDPGAVLTVTASSSNTTLLPQTGIVLTGTGTNRTIKLTPAANATGQVTVTVQVSDGCLTATDTFILCVRPLGGFGWQSIPLRNTGVSATGVLLANGAVDPNYPVTASPFGAGNAIVGTTIYFAGGTASRWISRSQGDGNPTGDYVYVQTFDLTGMNPASASISGRWACDNRGSIYLNNVLVPSSVITGSTGFYGWKNFSITGGFQANLNTLEFRVHDNSGYTGMRAELTGKAVVCNQPKQTYTGWAAEIAAARPGSGPLLASQTGDADNDGYTNAIEFALGLDPLSGSSLPPQATFAVVQQNNPQTGSLANFATWQIRYQLFNCAIHGEASNDLQTWRNCDLISTQPQPDGTLIDTYMDPVPLLTPVTRDFFRIKP